MQLYSEKISDADTRNLFNQIVKARLPFLGIFDFSGIFAMNFATFIINRQNNTIKFYLKDKPSFQSLSALIFPFRLSESKEFANIHGRWGVVPRFFMLSGTNDFLDYMLKESVEELRLHMCRFMGGTFAFGTAIDQRGRKTLVFVPTPSRFMMVDLEKNPSVYIEILEPIPKRMSTVSKFPLFEEPGQTLGVDNYDVFQHTMIVGSSGTGKSKGMYNLLRAVEAYHKDGVRMLILDPHGEFARMFHDRKIVDFVESYVEPLDMGGQKTPLLTQLIAQLIATSIGQENKYSERVLFYAVYLLTEIEKLTLTNISSLLTDSAVRAEFVSSSENPEVKRFFDEEFNDIYIHHFNDAVLPILNFVGEYQLYLGKNMKKEGLVELLQKNRVVVVSFDPHFFGKRMISFLAGAIINQMYILAITGKLQDKPTILAIDEFSRVENKVARDILVETRKFNLYLYISLQYLNQLSKEVYDAIIGNIRNIIAFKLSRQDATSISSIMEIKIEEFFKKNRTQTELEESKKEMFVRLNQRECIVRLFDGRTYLIPMKVTAVDTARWGWTDEMDKEQLLRQVRREPPVRINEEEGEKAGEGTSEVRNFSEQEPISLENHTSEGIMKGAPEGEPSEEPPRKGRKLHDEENGGMEASQEVRRNPFAEFGAFHGNKERTSEEAPPLEQGQEESPLVRKRARKAQEPTDEGGGEESSSVRGKAQEQPEDEEEPKGAVFKKMKELGITRKAAAKKGKK